MKWIGSPLAEIWPFKIFLNDLTKNFHTSPKQISGYAPSHLLVERVNFAPHVVVSAVVCFEEKERLHFVEEIKAIRGQRQLLHRKIVMIF